MDVPGLQGPELPSIWDVTYQLPLVHSPIVKASASALSARTSPGLSAELFPESMCIIRVLFKKQLICALFSPKRSNTINLKRAAWLSPPFSPAVTSWLLINYSAFLNMHRGLINN